MNCKSELTNHNKSMNTTKWFCIITVLLLLHFPETEESRFFLKRKSPKRLLTTVLNDNSTKSPECIKCMEKCDKLVGAMIEYCIKTLLNLPEGYLNGTTRSNSTFDEETTEFCETCIERCYEGSEWFQEICEAGCLKTCNIKNPNEPE